MKVLRFTACAGLALGFASLQALAQPVISAKSGVVSYNEGDVFLADQKLAYSPTHFEDIKENQTIRTEDGRAEILLTPGVVLRLGEHSSLRMITNRLIDTRLELVTGSAIVEADQIAKDTSVTIACKDAQVALAKSGIYRFDAEPARLRVFKGTASVALNGRDVEVGGGKTLALDGASEVAKFEANDTDSLDRWSGHRAEYMAMANVSSAKTLMGSSAISSLGWGMGQPCSGIWNYNSWYGMMTYVPCSGRVMSPYGYGFWSPYTVYNAYYAPVQRFPVNQGGGSNSGFPYNAAQQTSSGYSGVMAASPSMGSMGSMPSSASAGSTASASASAGSAGHGAAAGGGAASGGAAAGGHGR